MEIKETNINSLLSVGLKREFSEEIQILEVVDVTYPVEKTTWANWFVFSCRSFLKLNEKIKEEGIDSPKSFCYLGSGLGADAIGAFYAFKDLNQIVLTDVDPRAAKIAKSNLLIRKDIDRVEVIDLAGNLCQPLKDKGYKFDVMYEALSNIPMSSDNLAWENFDPQKFVKSETNEDIKLNLKKSAEKYFLESHLSSLVECRDYLKENGSLILVIAGRSPLYPIFDMIKGTGYDCEELVSGFRLKNESQEVIESYAQAEDKDNSLDFNFYLYDQAIEILEENDISKDNPIIENGSSEDFNIILKPARINARKARELRRNNPNIKIAITIHILRAKKTS